MISYCLKKSLGRFTSTFGPDVPPHTTRRPPGFNEEFDAVSTLVELGLDVHIDHVYPLADYSEAMTRLEAGEQLGKIVLRHPEG